jgi:hypothetical protein
MTDYPAIALAKLTVVKAKPSPGDPFINVHFNPASLQLTLSSELRDNSKNGPKQYIAKATAKLKFELIFDTTGTGESVLKYTTRLQAFVIPPNFRAPDKKNPTQIPPPTVKFDWGAIAFQGVAEGYQETIDFFSADGVPLRATVSLTLSQQDQVFEDRSSRNVAGGVEDDGADLATASGVSPDQLANQGNAPAGARTVATASGAESLRASFIGELVAGAAVSLGGPISFASGGVSLGASAGASAGLGLELGAAASAGIGIGGGFGGGVSAGISGGLRADVSAGAGASVGVGFSAGIGGEIGASLAGMARLSATEGAFAGLRSNVALPFTSSQLDIAAVRANFSTNSTARTDSAASFRVGGRANVSSSAGLRADVGATASARGNLSFDAD